MTTLKQAAKIEKNIRQHNELMIKLMKGGMSRETASEMAYNIVTKKLKK